MNVATKLTLVLVLGSLFCTLQANSTEDWPELDGVFGVTNVGETSALAFWVPLSSEEAVSGLQWFNSDDTIVFPKILAVAGEQDHPELLLEAEIVGQNVNGGELEWSEFQFSQPLASASEGLYLIFQLPLESEFSDSGTGGGAGFGFMTGGEANRCWVTDDGIEWEAFTVPHQMAIIPVMNSNKSGNVLQLTRPGSSASPEAVNDFDINPEFPKISAIPNPFNPETMIKFSLPKGCQTVVRMYDLRGRLIQELLNRALPSGENEVQWNGKTNTGMLAPSGVYLVKISSGSYQETLRITLAK